MHKSANHRDVTRKPSALPDSGSVPPGTADTPVTTDFPTAPVRPMPESLEGLLQCAALQSKNVHGGARQATILLGIAAVRAQYDSAATVEAIRAAPPIPEILDSLQAAVLALAARDLNSALRAVDGLASDEHRRRCLAAMARQLVLLDTPRALRVAERIDPRIVREGILLEVVDVALEQSIETAQTVSDRIIEPLLNDYAAAGIAASGATTDFQKASQLAESIESPFVKQWAYLAMLLAMASHDPERALSLENKLPLTHHLDELHSRAAVVLAAEDADKALSVALRIGDRDVRIRTLCEVAHRLFPKRPAFAFHLLGKEVGEERALEHLTSWVDALCAGDDGDFEAAYEALRRKLSAGQGAALLLTCCRHRPREVRKLAMEVPPALVMPLRRCYLCAGIESDPGAVLEATTATHDMDRLRACNARRLAIDKPPEALAALAGITDTLVADETRLEIATDLLAARKNDEALEIVGDVADSYLRGVGLLRLLAEEDEAGEARRSFQAVLDELKDPWRTDDLRMRAALLLATRDLEFATRLAAGVVSPARTAQLLRLMMPRLGESDLARAAALSNSMPKGESRAGWCLEVAARLAAIDSRRSMSQP